MKKVLRTFAFTSLLTMSAFFIGHAFIATNFPNEYNATEKKQFSFQTAVPLSINPVKSEVKFVNSLSFSGENQYYGANLTLFNIIPIKSVKVSIVSQPKVLPCGIPFGVKIFTNGVMIVNISNVKTDNGMCNPAKISGLRKGDVITEADSHIIKNNEELAELIEKSFGKSINIKALRDNVPFDTQITPVQSCDDRLYHAGIWVRDSSAGIGTMTFYNSESKTFSGLGHGICDIDTGELLPLSHGDIIEASITGINKGRKGLPGELKGCFIDSRPIGKIYANTETGVYGILNNHPSNNQLLNVSMKQQAKVGPARVLTTLSGETPKLYDINIESINYNENNPTKNILISITDKELLEKTGGIVQGMSGSPIIQNDMIIGAVTHVFINEPYKGYAIFAETMLTNSNKIYRTNYKKTS